MTRSFDGLIMIFIIVPLCFVGLPFVQCFRRARVFCHARVRFQHAPFLFYESSRKMHIACWFWILLWFYFAQSIGCYYSRRSRRQDVSIPHCVDRRFWRLRSSSKVRTTVLWLGLVLDASVQLRIFLEPYNRTFRTRSLPANKRLIIRGNVDWWFSS